MSTVTKRNFQSDLILKELMKYNLLDNKSASSKKLNTLTQNFSPIDTELLTTPLSPD